MDNKTGNGMLFIIKKNRPAMKIYMGTYYQGKEDNDRTFWKRPNHVDKNNTDYPRVHVCDSRNIPYGAIMIDTQPRNEH